MASAAVWFRPDPDHTGAVAMLSSARRSIRSMARHDRTSVKTLDSPNLHEPHGVIGNIHSDHQSRLAPSH